MRGAGFTGGPRDKQERREGTQEERQKKPRPCRSISRASISTGEDRDGQPDESDGGIIPTHAVRLARGYFTEPFEF